MGNLAQTKQEIAHHITARTPLVIVHSTERERVERLLSSIASEKGIEMYYYTDAKQVTRLDAAGRGVTADAQNDPLTYIAGVFKKKRHATFVYGDVKRLSEDTMYSREIVNLLYLANESDSTLILITQDPVIQRIAQFGMIVTLDYPDAGERVAQIRAFTKNYASRFTVEWDENDIQYASTLLRGFSEIQIDNVLGHELVSSGGLYRERMYHLTGQKSRLYAAVSSVQEVHVPRDICVSGLENMKEWLSQKRQIFFASDDQLEQYGLSSPKGILLSGIPGCGKSYSAKMVALEWGLPLFRFDIGSIYDKWMGESERKMKEALEFIDRVSPCVLWIDEIEKALAVSHSGNDTGQRILGQFLFWLQESDSRVFLVATANDITALPSELFRKGRFSEIFFVDLPTAAEREQAILQYVQRCLRIRLREDQLSRLVEISDGFSFSEIEYAVKEIAQLLLIQGQEAVTMERICDTFRSVVPVEKRHPETVARLRQWGAERAVPAHK